MAKETDPEQETDEGDPPETKDDPGEGFEARVEAIIHKVLDPILGKDDSKPKQVTEPSKPRTQAAIEDDAEAKVRAALAKIKHEEEHENEHKKLKEQSERPPQTLRKLTKIMWGDQ